MSYLNKVIYLTEEQKNTLFANDTITVNGITVNYNSDDLYITPEEIDTAPVANSTNLVTSGGIYTAIHNYSPYSFTNGTAGNFTITLPGGSTQTISVGKPATAGTADKATAANLTTTASSIAYYNDTNGTFASDPNFIWDSASQTLTAYKLKGYVVAGQKSGTALGYKATAEGYQTTASGSMSHAEGWKTTASNSYSHAEGNISYATGEGAHSEGYNGTASGKYSHREGYTTGVTGDYGHVEGQNTYSKGRSQHVFGEYNIEDASSNANTRAVYVEIVGNGDSSARSNARTLDWNGNEVLAGNLTIANKVNLVFNTTTNALDFVFI